LALIGARSALRFGVGDGGSALAGGDGTDQRSDLAARRGGADPLLSLASGGAFFDGRLAATDRLTVSIGATSRRDARDLSLYGVTPNNPARVYAADAARIGVDYAAGDHLKLHGAILRLREASGLLGFQSVDPTQLGGGATTTAANFGFDWMFAPGFLLTGIGTVAHTESAGDQALTTGPGGIESTAAEVAVSKTGVFAAQDRLRLAVSKPLQAYRGQLRFSAYGVVDRQTGALGVIDQSVEAGDGRTPWTMEILYGRLLPSRAAEVSGFVRTEANVDNSVGAAVAYVLGARYRMRF
ncbi:MAG: hypothetical protein JSS35_05010, partial [Proteobacteria bacterium]|nr:hypothetical protein [Pseudomonadota bacterium]